MDHYVRITGKSSTHNVEAVLATMANKSTFKHFMVVESSPDTALIYTSNYGETLLGIIFRDYLIEHVQI